MEKLIFAFTGDVMLGRTVNEYINSRTPQYPWGNVLPIIKKADLSFVNLECAITSHKKESEMIKAFYFRADPVSVDVLKQGGINYVSLANNHVLDFGDAGLSETINLLDKNNIFHAGAGKSITDASRPALLEIKGLKVTVLSFSDYPREWAAEKRKAGLNYISVSLSDKNFSKIRQSIKDAKKQADIVVFSIHWGPNMRQYPPKDFVEFAHAVMDAGADIFHGHSAHVFQPIEIYNGKPIFYDCGDFIDDYAVDIDLRNDYALLYNVIISPVSKKIMSIELVPCIIHSCRVNLADESLFEIIAQKIEAISLSFGTKIRRVKNKLVVDINN